MCQKELQLLLDWYVWRSKRGLKRDSINSKVLRDLGLKRKRVLIVLESSIGLKDLAMWFYTIQCRDGFHWEEQWSLFIGDFLLVETMCVERSGFADSYTD